MVVFLLHTYCIFALLEMMLARATCTCLSGRHPFPDLAAFGFPINTSQSRALTDARFQEQQPESSEAMVSNAGTDTGRGHLREKGGIEGVERHHALAGKGTAEL